MPRPSLVPDPVTAFGKKRAAETQVAGRVNVLSPAERAKIRPKVLLEPPKPYVSARDSTRQRVLANVRRGDEGLGYRDSMDVLLPRLHKVAENPQLPYKRRIVDNSDLPPYVY